MKKIVIIGAGISGLYLANLLEKDSNYDYKIFEKSSKVAQGENPLKAFLFFAKFSIFVSVEQGEVTFFLFFCFRKSVFRVNSGHKTMLSKKEKK